jgi:hypothetical protein
MGALQGTEIQKLFKFLMRDKRDMREVREVPKGRKNDRQIFQ